MGKSISKTNEGTAPLAPFVCPSNWIARPRLPAACRCRSLNVDPLVAAMFHNRRCSRLCQLPEELLIGIMQQVDLLDIQCLRRTCRLFLRLYSSSEFSSTHNENLRALQDYEKFSCWLDPWCQPRPDCWPAAKLPPLLGRDTGRYCNDCMAARHHPDWKHRADRLTAEFLHCSGCRIDHPRAMFSTGQRQETISSLSRVCIAHEGFIRLCDHRVIKFSNVAQIADSLSQLNTGSRRAVVYIAICKSPSHLPKHHRSGDFQPRHADMYPCATVEGSSHGPVELVLRWVGHLSLPEMDDKEVLTAEFMHEKIKQDLRPGAAEHIAPALSTGRIPEMGCFDPNRCCCLSYPGNERLGSAWSFMPIQDIKFPSCRVDPREKLGWASHRTCLTTTGVKLNGSSYIEVDAQPCLANTDCLQVEYIRRIDIIPQGHAPGAANMGWWQAIDPGSYNLTSDTESFGVYWCRQEGCANYFRYMRKPFIRYCPQIHQQCGTSCPPN